MKNYRRHDHCPCQKSVPIAQATETPSENSIPFTPAMRQLQAELIHQIEAGKLWGLDRGVRRIQQAMACAGRV